MSSEELCVPQSRRPPPLLIRGRPGAEKSLQVLYEAQDCDSPVAVRVAWSRGPARVWHGGLVRLSRQQALTSH